MSFEIVKAIAEDPGELALVTVIDVQGSAPRHEGSTMLVRAGDDRHPLRGTVGGGKGEARVIAEALECIAGRTSRLLTLEFQGTEVEGQDMICGGTTRLTVESVAEREPYRIACERLRSGERVLLVKVQREDRSIAVALLDERGAELYGSVPAALRPGALRALDTGAPAYLPEERAFLHPLVPEEKLLILGGGYIGQALAWHASRLELNVTVGDDRAAFSAAGRFPPGTGVETGPYTAIVERFPFDSATYVVMVTRGHLTDLECLRAVMKKRYRYAGFIGSARKVRLVRDQLISDGLDQTRIDALHAPVGLDVGAESPEELAVAILAEIIAVRRNAAIPRP